MSATDTTREPDTSTKRYVLERQIGFLLRQATQRHAAVFASINRDNITPPQLSVLVKLLQNGVCWQTRLGRMTGMDVATMKGVTDRLIARRFVERKVDPDDGRRMLLKLTRSGKAAAKRALDDSILVHQQALNALSKPDQDNLIALLSKMAGTDEEADSARNELGPAIEGGAGLAA